MIWPSVCILTWSIVLRCVFDNDPLPPSTPSFKVDWSVTRFLTQSCANLTRLMIRWCTTIQHWMWGWEGGGMLRQSLRNYAILTRVLTRSYAKSMCLRDSLRNITPNLCGTWSDDVTNRQSRFLVPGMDPMTVSYPHTKLDTYAKLTRILTQSYAELTRIIC